MVKYIMAVKQIQPFLYIHSTHSLTHDRNIDKIDFSPWRAYAGMSSVIGTGIPFPNHEFKYIFKHFGRCSLIMQFLHSQIVLLFL